MGMKPIGFEAETCHHIEQICALNVWPVNENHFFSGCMSVQTIFGNECVKQLKNIRQ